MAVLTKKPGYRLAKSYTIEPEVNHYVVATKGELSASKRVNELLKRAMIQEQLEQLDREAAAFFATEAKNRKESKAFQHATKRTLERE